MFDSVWSTVKIYFILTFVLVVSVGICVYMLSEYSKGNTASYVRPMLATSGIVAVCAALALIPMSIILLYSIVLATINAINPPPDQAPMTPQDYMWLGNNIGRYVNPPKGHS